MLQVWTPEGVAVTRRRALLQEYAKDFERPGWSNNSKSLFKYTPQMIEAQRLHKIKLQQEKERKKANKKRIRKGEFPPSKRSVQDRKPAASSDVWA
jgi:hypothetical protein